MRWYTQMGRRVWFLEVFQFLFKDKRIANGPTVEEFWGKSLHQQEYVLAKPKRREIEIRRVG